MIRFYLSYLIISKQHDAFEINTEGSRSTGTFPQGKKINSDLAVHNLRQ